ncbi:unnamed protein product [Symbiodinium pilosum]|uniref:Uncharacterized protein n=1 Tax=Symbiodinium pilosum TaxID=2952 RepID=A0A812RW37_SYMPI|nr:unnamed protein product [Symbiodinium pilosum]
MNPEGRVSVGFQVAVIGNRGAGKSALIRAAPINEGAHEEAGDGVQLHKAACFYNSFSVMADFVEMPPDDRYYGLLPYFGGAAACIILVVNILDSNGHSDLCNRLAALGTPPPCGLLVVQGSLPSSTASGEERRRLEPLRDVAARWGLKFLRFETLEQLARAQILQSVCDLVLGDIPDRGDPMHLLGRRVARGMSP